MIFEIRFPNIQPFGNVTSNNNEILIFTVLYDTIVSSLLGGLAIFKYVDLNTERSWYRDLCERLVTRIDKDQSKSIN